MNANAFEVLRLDPTASEEEIVRQAAQLRQRAGDEAEQNDIRQAVQALTGRPEDRQRLALLTHPRPQYQCPELERFVAAFRRVPPPTSTPTAVPELDQHEFLRLVIDQVIEELEPAPAPFEQVASTPSGAEMQRLLAEALWQSMLCDLWA